jgi:nucleotide-binding universal stress UspA family protein
MSAIVVGTDGSEGARAAVMEAARLAKGMQQRMVVVSAYGPSAMATMSPEAAAAYAADDGRGAAEEALRTAEQDLRASGVECEMRAVCGNAADSLVDVAKLEQAATIVVGSRGMRGPRRLLGSVPNAVSHRAPCSVLIVRTD